MVMERRAAPLFACAFAIAGCGQVGVMTGEPAVHSYQGPLYVGREDAEHARAGAAGDVVDCDTWGAGGFSAADVYAEGATANSPERALTVARSEALFGGMQEHLQVAKTEQDRVLYVLEVQGVVKQAVIVRDGPATEGAGGPGWYVESWAHCDYAELPRSFTDSIGLQVWTDRSGQPAPTTTIESWTGPEHCDWQSMTFLYLAGAQYVRDPEPDLADFVAEPYQPHAILPPNAIDTGFERNGDHLWLSPDKQRALVGSQHDVELWPRTIQRLGCE
jgi:hypothetical protein